MNDGVLSFFIGVCVGVLVGSLLVGAFINHERSVDNAELVKRGYKTYHPTTGKLVWKDEVTE